MKAQIFNIHDVVLLMTVAECFLLAIFQAVLPVTNRLASVLLSCFLLCVAVGSACILVLWNGDVHVQPFFDRYLLPYFLVTALILKGPALYLYVASLTRESFRLQPRHLWHLTPVAVAMLWLAIFRIDSLDMSFRSVDATDFSRSLVDCVWHVVKALPFIYGIAAVLLTKKYQAQLKDQYSDISTTEPGWLKVLTIGFLASWSLSGIAHIIAQTASPDVSDSFGIADNYVTFILINALFTYSLVYAHKLLTTKHEPVKDKNDEKLTDSAIEKVQQGMEVHKLYLKHNLNIEEFSKRIDLPVKEVSAVINKHYGTNFFEFMNSYRVEEAKRLLSDEKHADMTVLDVLLQSGFNSKSAFHRFFNRLVGVSPTEFRKNGAPDAAGKKPQASPPSA